MSRIFDTDTTTDTDRHATHREHATPRGRHERHRGAAPSPSAVPSARSAPDIMRKRLTWLVVLLVCLGVSIFGSLIFGAKPIPAPQLPHALSGAWAMLLDPSLPYDPSASVIAQLRVPRTILGLVIGAALGVAGSLIQGHTRNPLADPGILGVNAGAAFAVVVFYTYFNIVGTIATVFVAFVGAVAATVLVFTMTSIGSGKINPLSVILGGAALSAVLGALTAGVVLINVDSLDKMRFWQAGSLASATLPVIGSIVPFVIVGIAAAWFSARELNLLNLGDDVARGLGVNTLRARITGMLIIALLAAAATAAAGPITFVGLVVPHVVRAITGPDYRWIVPYSAVTGAVLLLLGDTVGRVVARPGELQVGIVLAFVGAPLVLWLITRKKLAAL